MWFIKIHFLMMNWAVNWDMWVNFMNWFVVVNMMRCSICIVVWEDCMVSISMSIEPSMIRCCVV
jgi:hypothetical protein